jgi:hypothetical protein
MYISNCPRCHDTFRVPLGDSPKGARAQCPWCAEEFPLAEVLNQLPPVLKIVSADPTLAERFGRLVEDIAVDNGAQPHSAAHYLSKPDVGRAIAAALGVD